MAYNVLIFDLDGTLVDSFPGIQMSLSVAMRGTGLQPWDLEETKRHVGHGVEVLLESAVGPERKEKAIQLFRKNYGETCHKTTPLLPFVGETLSLLRERGYLLAVATNKPLLFTTPILEHLGVASLFSCVMGPEKVKHRKPHPDMIRAIQDRLHASDRHCLYVGDMPLDAETASQAGVDCLLVASGAFTLDRLQHEASVPVVMDFSGVPAHLRKTET